MVTEPELKRVRTSARRSAVAVRESALSRAVQLSNDAVMYDDPNRINTTADKMVAVTAADVQRFAKAYLRIDNEVVMQTMPGVQPLPAAPKPPAAPASTRSIRSKASSVPISPIR